MRVIGITGTGGAGKTTLAANIASCLALDGIRTLLIDADLYFPNVGTHFGTRSRYTIHDFLGNTHMDVEWLLHPVHGVKGLYLILGDESRIPGPSVSYKPLGSLIELVRENFGAIIIDFPSGLPIMTHSIVEHLDYQVLVIQPEAVPRQDTIPWVKELVLKYSRLGTGKPLIVLNKHFLSRKEELRIESYIADELGYPVLVSIPHDRRFIESLHEGMPLCLLGDFPESVAILGAEIAALL